MIIKNIPQTIKKRKIYISPFLSEVEDDLGNTITSYGKPFLIRSTVSTISVGYERDEFGDDLDSLFQIILPYDEWIGKIKEKDNVYLHSKDFDEEPYGINADYYIYGIHPQNNIIRYFIKKRD